MLWNIEQQPRLHVTVHTVQHLCVVRAAISEVWERFSEAVETARTEAVALEHSGQPVTAVPVSPEQCEELKGAGGCRGRRSL